MEQPVLKLEASAGSGKTYRLALEYIGRLLVMFNEFADKKDNLKFRQKALGSILAITFTVKAAQEMKGRIMEKLKHFALSLRGYELNAADKEFLAQLAAGTGLASERIVKLSGDLIELILASYDDFNVKTIDSLMNAMVKVVAPDLDLPADYEIAVDARDELEARGRALLADLADNQWPRLEQFLREFRSFSTTSSWKTDVAVTDKVIDLFRKLLRQGNNGMAEAPDDLRQRMATSWRSFRDALQPLFPILQEREPGGKKRRFVSATYLKDALLARIGEALESPEDFSELEKFFSSTFFRKDNPEVLLLKDAPTGHRERFLAAFRMAQAALRNLAFAFSAFKTIPYREFLGDFTKAWSMDKDTLFVEEFSQTLAGLFAKWREEAFPYLYLKMSDRFFHFLFDEFQDTSSLQFKALAPIIDEVLSGREKASLFIVGDRKQAIYRWRGGNSGLMEENVLRDEVPAIGNLVKNEFSHNLNKNWRSCREIIDFNNDFWDPAAVAQIAAEPAIQEAIAANFTDSKQEPPAGHERAGGYVELSLQVEAEKTGEESLDLVGEAEAGVALSGRQLGEIKKIITRLREHGYQYTDIAVLVRKNIQVRDIVRLLGREKIPTISDQSLMLDSNRRINEIIAFLKFLDYPPDNLNFHAFVSGQIFQKEAQQSFSQEMAAFSEDVFIGCRGPMYKLFQEKFPECWAALIKPFFQAVGFLPPYDLFSDITQMFHVYENFRSDTPFIMALGDALHGSEREEGNSIAGFLNRWKKMVEDEETPFVTIPENTPGVRVLTMHQSKGLEFAAVIVPLNDSGGKNEEPLYWDQEGLFYINKELALAHPELKDKYQEEKIRSSIDLLNLLYVSFTRAREALFVPVAVKEIPEAPVADKSDPAKRITRASDVVCRHPLLAWLENKPDQPFRRGELQKKEQKPVKKTTPTDVPSKKVLTRSWQAAYLVFDKSPIDKRRDRSGAERGERIHDLLSRLGDITDPKQLDSRVRELAAQSGWPANDTETVTSYLCRDDVFSILSRGHKIHLEKEIVDNTGTMPKFKRLDRLQVGPGEVMVVDFKTGNEKSDEYYSQMREYLAAVAPLYPERKCGGFLLYIDRGEAEEVSCSN